MQRPHASEYAAMLGTATGMLGELKQRLRSLRTDCLVHLQGNNISVVGQPEDPFPMLCRVVPRVNSAHESREESVVMLSAVDTLEYRPAKRATFDRKAQQALNSRLDRAKIHQAPAWPAFLNQVTYSVATRRRFYIWIGDPSLIDDRPPIRTSRLFPCYEEDTTAIYHARVLAMLALLTNVSPRISAVMYIDADVWFSDASLGSMARYGCCLPEALLQLAPHASVLANGNHWMRPYGVFFNTGIMLWRNTPWSLTMLASWWRVRCGWADQTVLWSLLFASWANETAGAFKYSPSKLGSLKLGMKYAQKHLESQLKANAFPKTIDWPDHTNVFTKSGALLKPLELPHVLLLPSATVQWKANSNAHDGVSMILKHHAQRLNKLVSCCTLVLMVSINGATVLMFLCFFFRTSEINEATGPSLGHGRRSSPLLSHKASRP